MLYKLLLLVSSVVLISGKSKKFTHGDFNDGNHVETFARWMKFFDKKFDTIDEEVKRFKIFLENWKFISSSNEKTSDYTLGLNQFGDLTSDEFKLYVHGHSGSCLVDSSGKKIGRKLNGLKPKVSVPSSVDWTTKGVVTPVKNQGQCGSCWAFSTTGTVESRAAINGKGLTSLSEQQLMDCSTSYGNQGCNGGSMRSALQYVSDTGGLCSESAYPYEGADGSCRASECTLHDAINGYSDVPSRSTQALEEAISSGPVSIGVEADQQSFQFYSGGVLTAQCGTSIDHGVLAVGYGSENGQDFWKVKNSWGESWGVDGYIKLCRNCNANGGDGECGILDNAQYPN